MYNNLYIVTEKTEPFCYLFEIKPNMFFLQNMTIYFLNDYTVTNLAYSSVTTMSYIIAQNIQKKEITKKIKNIQCIHKKFKIIQSNIYLSISA